MTTNLLQVYLDRRMLVSRIEQDAFPRQRAFLDDKSRLKAALTTRRAGKSMLAAMDLVRTCVAYPNSNVLYVSLTRDHAKRILKKDCLDVVLAKYGIRTKHNGVELVTRLIDYNSYIYMTGVDACDSEMEKVLGNKYRLVYVDESASYSINLANFVYKYLKPTTSDNRGTIVLVGTPGNNIYCFFFKVTMAKELGWSLHRWTAFDNPHVSTQMREDMEEIEKNRPEFKRTAAYKQMYLGNWCVDESNLVYKYDSGINSIVSYPWTTSDAPRHVLGVDLGYDDATSFVLVAYSKFSRELIIKEAWKRKKMTLTAVADVLRKYATLTQLDDIVIDNADKQAVEELRQRHKLGLIAAQKTAKNDYIEMMNDDFRQGRIKVIEHDCKALVDEWSKLVWDERKLTRGSHKEHAGCENHCCDAALYAWRRCYHWIDPIQKPFEARDPDGDMHKRWLNESEEIEQDKSAWWEQ